jgi:protein phosphatase-4 regulatory subunit 3
MGILECKPKIYIYIYITKKLTEPTDNPKTPGMKAKHREFIKTRGNVKQVVRLTDESITRRIDHTFRLEYLQAILLNTESDEGLMGVMNNLIFQYHVEIVNYFQNNHVLLTELFDQIKTATTESRHGIIRFVHQLCQLTKQMQNSARVSLFRSLASYGLFDLMCFALEEDDRMMRTNSLNILASFTNLDVASVRSHIMIQSRDEAKELKPLLEVIVEQFASDADYDLKVQYFEILRLLLDPTGNTPIVGPGANDPASKMNPETDEFLQIFYDKYVSTLLNPIERLDIKPISLKGIIRKKKKKRCYFNLSIFFSLGPIELLHLTQDQAQLCLYLCEFLCFAVRNHGYRSKYILLSSNLFLKVAQLYRSKYAYIKLGKYILVVVTKRIQANLFL